MHQGGRLATLGELYPAFNNPIPMQKVDIISGDLRIRMQSEDADGTALWKRTVRHLIVEADIHGWEKSGLEYADDSSVLERYCCDVLLSLATAYKFEADLYKPDSDPTKDQPEALGTVLTRIVARLEEAGCLGESVHSAAEDDDGDLFDTFEEAT